MDGIPLPPVAFSHPLTSKCVKLIKIWHQFTVHCIERQFTLDVCNSAS